MSKVLGVIGGMGPAATVAFLARVQALTPAKGDADHIRVVMDLNPQVPDRNTRPGEAEAVLGRMAAGLAAAGAAVIAMPCNTAHGQAAAIRAVCAAQGLSFIDMIAATADAAAASGAGRIAVLATPGGERLYREALAARGVEAVLLDGADRQTFMGLVYGVKRGDVGEAARAGMRGLAQALADAGAKGLIAGCTEVPLLLRAQDVAVPLTDSAEVLAQACVEACL
ncbi:MULTISPECIES: aspartate/glutamate racemase family protein [unclassified Brevundimonas]|uniref:aspartate/glutamate racemase family protein n=1 Tax=unclassified Brevundimonas TaxID=2622653 RepID=UPI002006B807|nr:MULTISPECIES: amino acid racemase [unclassified Brevundimonas]MCK6104174.1 amino acid racemase [Brevundimonas sp. EYE_349]